MSKLDCLLCQIDIPATATANARDQHISRVAAMVEKQLLMQKANMVVLPELASIDYSREAFRNLDALAEPKHGPSFEVWSAIARRHRVVVVYGFALQLSTGYTIATGVVDDEGKLIDVYHKLHLAQFGDSMEKEYLTTGDRRLVLFDINGFKVAPIICYDIRVPELCRTLAVDHQVDVIVHTGAYARDPSYHTWHAFAQTRAVENQLYFVSLNRAGHHFGGSIICPPWIDEQRQPLYLHDHREEFRMVTLHRSQITNARRDYTFLQDRLSGYNLPVTADEMADVNR